MELRGFPNSVFYSSLTIVIICNVMPVETQYKGMAAVLWHIHFGSNSISKKKKENTLNCAITGLLAISTLISVKVVAYLL